MIGHQQSYVWTKVVLIVSLLGSSASYSDAFVVLPGVNQQLSVGGGTTTTTRSVRLWASSSPPSPPVLKDDSYSIATRLLGSLLEARKAELDSSPVGIVKKIIGTIQGKQKQEKEMIEGYIQRILDMPRQTYDPSKSLFGPLYCTLYNYNPSNPNQGTPLWEKISLKSDNLKGQQYFVNSDYEMSIVNYAEIFGSLVAVRAKATFSPVKKQSDEKEDTPSGPTGWIQGLTAAVGKGSSSSSTSSPPPTTLRTCPDVYNVRAFEGEIILGDVKLPLSIDGTAKLVVLYADPRLRIFVSSDRSDSAVGTWEQAGLVVVQVRSDLVTGTGPIDLRS